MQTAAEGYGKSRSLFTHQLLFPPFRESHCRRVDIGVLLHQLQDVVLDGVFGLNVVRPINQAAQQGIQAAWVNCLHIHPCGSHLLGGRQLWLHRIDTVPYTRMVGAAITQCGQRRYPAVENLMLRDVETSYHRLFYRGVGKVAVEFSQRAERSDLKRFPRRGHTGPVVFREMLLDKILFGTRQFRFQGFQAVLVHFRVFEQFGIHKPERPVFHREMLDDACPQSNFHRLNGRENHSPQFFVEVVEIYGRDSPPRKGNAASYTSDAVRKTLVMSCFSFFVFILMDGFQSLFLASSCPRPLLMAVFQILFRPILPPKLRLYFV